MNDRQSDEERVFHIARGIGDQETRSAYLDQICADDQALRERVEELLQTHESEQSFLKSNDDHEPSTIDHTSSNERPGSTIGRYKLMEQIGEGGMGTVYVAQQDKPIRRKVALKVIKPGMDSKAVIARFEAERQALAMMDHPNIAKVLDAETTGSGRPYFAMELVKGVPITEYCDRNKLTIRERLELFIQVCQAIQHAHQKGIIHRDIKPSNVLVTLHDGKPVPKVIDFGVAKALNTRLTDKTIYTEHLQVIGTLLYMSPEQAELSGLDIDTRSDIYSLGVLLYELLTGTTPFQKSDLDQAGFDQQRRMIRDKEPPRASVRISSLGKTATTIAEHRQTDAKKLSQLVRRDLDWIMLKSLEKDRTRRYDTAVGLAEDVERYLSNEPVEAFPPSWRYRCGKFINRNQASVVVATAIATLIAIAVGGTLWQARIANLNAIELEASLDRLSDAQFDRGMTAALSGQDVEEFVQFLHERKKHEKAEILKTFADYTRWSQHGGEDLVKQIDGVAEKYRDNLAIQALRAMCLDGAGKPSNYWKASQGLLEKTPQPDSLEAHVFMAKALQCDPEARDYVDKAMKIRFSPYSMVIRARVYANYIHQSGDLEPFQETIRNIIATEQIDLSSSELGRIDSLASALELAATAKSFDEAEMESAAMYEAGRLVKIVEQLEPPTHWDLYYVACYYYMKGNKPEAIQFFRKCAPHSDYFSCAYSALAFELGKPAGALNVEGPLQDFARGALLIANGDSEEASEIAKSLVHDGSEKRWIWSELSGLMLLAWLRDDALVSHSKAVVNNRSDEKLLAVEKWILNTLVEDYFCHGYSLENRSRILASLNRNECDFPVLYRMLAQLAFGIESLGLYRRNRDIETLREAVACLEDCSEHRIIYYPLHKWGRALAVHYRKELENLEEFKGDR